jgi:aminomethyltransferase
MFADQGLPPVVSATAWRTHVPLYANGRQIGRATSGTWSPILKRNIALGSLPPAYEAPGSRVRIEWTVEARRGLLDATVVSLPFLDLERKRV